MTWSPDFVRFVLQGDPPISSNAHAPELSSALEDYLETIYELARDRGVARVKDIAKARGVKPGSVSPALRRLSDQGLVRYERREFVTLSPAGEAAARRVCGRHGLLARFFTEVLLVSPGTASKDACAVEHQLSDETVDRLVRLFEFLRACPEGAGPVLGRFHACPLVREDAPPCNHTCENKKKEALEKEAPLCPLSHLRPGERGRVTRVDAGGSVRQRLLDMGVLPDVVLEMVRRAPAGDPLWVRLQGYQLSLRKGEAVHVIVAPLV